QSPPDVTSSPRGAKQPCAFPRWLKRCNEDVGVRRIRSTTRNTKRGHPSSGHRRRSRDRTRDDCFAGLCECCRKGYIPPGRSAKPPVPHSLTRCVRKQREGIAVPQNLNHLSSHRNRSGRAYEEHIAEFVDGNIAGSNATGAADRSACP